MSLTGDISCFLLLRFWRTDILHGSLVIYIPHTARFLVLYVRALSSACARVSDIGHFDEMLQVYETILAVYAIK